MEIGQIQTKADELRASVVAYLDSVTTRFYDETGVELELEYSQELLGHTVNGRPLAHRELSLLGRVGKTEIKL